MSRLSAVKRRNNASKAGKAAHAAGKAHEWTPDEAAEAGRLGGLAVAAKPGHMARIGRKGGKSVGKRKRRAKR